MAVRHVICYPDARLKQACLPVQDSPADELLLARDLVETMAAFPGCVGIAAPQVGELVRMAAIDVTGHRRASSCAGCVVLVDPVIVSEEGSVVMREGCLSIPDFTGNVRRSERVAVAARAIRAMVDAGGSIELVDEGHIELACDAYEARVVLHELDHLDGVLFLDRVDSARDIFPRKVYR